MVRRELKVLSFNSGFSIRHALPVVFGSSWTQGSDDNSSASIAVTQTTWRKHKLFARLVLKDVFGGLWAPS